MQAGDRLLSHVLDVLFVPRVREHNQRCRCVHGQRKRILLVPFWWLAERFNLHADGAGHGHLVLGHAIADADPQ